MPVFDTRKVRPWNLTPRESVLALLGVIFLSIGFGQIVVHTVQVVPWEYHTYLPLWFKAGKFISAGLICWFSLRTGRFQWLAFAALIVPPMIRATSFAGALIMSFFEPTNFFAYIIQQNFTIWQLRGTLFNNMFIWTIIAVLIYKIAALQDPPEVPIINPERVKAAAETVILVQEKETKE